MENIMTTVAPSPSPSNGSKWEAAAPKDQCSCNSASQLHGGADSSITEETKPRNGKADIFLFQRAALANGYAPEACERVAAEDGDVAKILQSIQPYIMMAVAAYSDKINMPDMVLRSKLLTNATGPSDTQVHVCILKDHSVAFAFRGTEILPDIQHNSFEAWRKTISDILTDIQQVQEVVQLYNGSEEPVYTSPSKMQAHQGFQQALKDVTAHPTKNLMCVLKELGMEEAEEVGRVVCVGHSLGGALATLCAKWCREVAFPRAEIGCVTLGSPRVGNSAFVEDFDKHVVRHGWSYRIVNEEDPVPGLPNWLTYRCAPYNHVSRPIYLWTDGANAKMRARLGGKRPTCAEPWQIDDHTTNSYLSSMDAVLTSATKDSSM